MNIRETQQIGAPALFPDFISRKVKAHYFITKKLHRFLAYIKKVTIIMLQTGNYYKNNQHIV